MPTYEYECPACGHRFERRQGIKDAPLKSCPRCRGRVRRVISGGTGFIVKGGQGRTGAGTDSCSLHSSGRACCGREERCDKPPCRQGE
jgi:putative FmdB family regulatory protein